MKLPVVLLCCAILFSGEPNSSSHIPQHKTEQQPAPAPVTAVNNNTCAPNTGSAQNGSPKWYASPEWWLVILGFPTLFFLGWQANETRRAANAARISAEAIERSVGKMDEANR